ncbi:endonuclease MutS2 [Enterococcus sp. LJL120]
MNNQLLQTTQFNEINDRLMHLTISDFAKELLADRRPLTNFNAVKRKLAETDEASNLLGSGQHVPFMGLTRIQQLTKKIEKGLILEIGELIEYGDFLRSFRLITKLFEKNQYQAPTLASYAKDLADLSEVEEAINQSIQGNQIASESSRQLRKIRNQIQKIEKDIEGKMAKHLRNWSGSNFLQERLILKKADRYTLPVKVEFKNKVKGSIVESSRQGQTVYIEPNDVSKLNEELIFAKAEEVAEVYQILAYLTGLIAENLPTIHYSKDIIVELDIIFARGKLSRSFGGRKPDINHEDVLRLKQVKHPLLDNPVPLSLELGAAHRGLIITGPNAGGKTVVLKTVALTCLLTMSGIFVANQAGTTIPILDELFIDIGDQQSLENALSTFSGHMQNISQILAKSRNHTLVLLDEIGSGTEPKEGAALGIALMEEMYLKGALVIATTHYGEIKDFALQHQDFVTAAMAFDSASLSPKYQLLLGEVGDSNAFWIAKKMQVPANVLTRSRDYLQTKNYSSEKKVFAKRQKAAPKVEAIAFDKGDRVYSAELQKTGLYYEEKDPSYGIIYLEGEFKTVLKRRLELKGAAKDLYPADYDLESLFADFHERKKIRDLERGSKKAHKQLAKEAKERAQQLATEQK